MINKGAFGWMTNVNQVNLVKFSVKRFNIRSLINPQVSQNWFCQEERGLATLLLAMSNPLGLVLGQLVTPLIVSSPSQLPLLNLVWFLPALPGFFPTIVGVRSSLPPSPPSPR